MLQKYILLQRVAASLERENLAIDATLQTPGSATRITVAVQRILLKIEVWVEVMQVDRLPLFYNCHQGGSRYHPEALELLPLDLHSVDYLRQTPSPGRSLHNSTWMNDSMRSEWHFDVHASVISRQNSCTLSLDLKPSCQNQQRLNWAHIDTEVFRSSQQQYFVKRSDPGSVDTDL